MEESETGLFPTILGNRTIAYDYDTAKSMFSVATPVLVLLTLLNNIFVIVVLYIDPKLYSPSCIQHAGIATCNSLLGLVQMPVFIYFFAGDTFRRSVSSEWCGAYRIMGYALPQFLHTASLWQLVGLAIQRYLCFAYPFACVAWYNNITTRKITFVAVGGALLCNIFRFFDFEVADLTDLENGLTASPDHTSVGCRTQYRFTTSRREYTIFVHWFQVCVVHILPCAILVVMSIMLMQSVYRNNKRRMNLSIRSVQGRRLARWKTLKESSVIVLVGLCLVVEIPSMVVRIIAIADGYGLRDLGDQSVQNSVVVTHFLLIMSYYFYIYIYVIMNHEFRCTFMGMIRKVLPRSPSVESMEMLEIRERGVYD